MVFLWFLLFIFRIIKSNPFWILVFSYIITFGEFLYLKKEGANNYNLTKFMIINVILLIYSNFNVPFKFYDFKIAFNIILVYILTLIILNKNPIIAYKRMLNTYINDDNKYRTYISKIYDDLYNFWNPISSRI